jgi:hypothetical protein
VERPLHPDNRKDQEMDDEINSRHRSRRGRPALNNLFEIRAGEIACTKATTPAIATSRNA